MTASDNQALHIGIWVDLSEALLAVESVSMEAPIRKNAPELQALYSNVEPSCRSTGGRGGHFGYQHTSVRSASRNERRRDHEINAFLEEIAANLDKHPQHKVVATLTIAGPGLAKQQLATKLKDRHPQWPAPELKNTASRISEYEKIATLGWPHRRMPANL